MTEGGRPPVVLHLDMDAFYAAVEVREDPALAGKPLIIGHAGPRGVVSTCSYEARRYGVRSAMPSVTAMRLCPDAVWRPGRMELYVRVSRRLRRILDDFSPLVEPLSIDEAFLDLTGVVADLAGGAAVARQLKRRILEEERLTASVGVAPNKFLAKLASDLEKPDGLVVLPLDAVPRVVWPLPVERLWGVGPRTAERLRAAGLATIGALRAAGHERVRALVGASGAAHLLALADGVDPRPVRCDREARSLSEERTYARDLRDPAEIDRALLERSEGVAREMRRSGLRARTVTIKVRTGSFTTWTRSRTLPAPSDRTASIVEAARRLFRERIRLGREGVRLLGVGVSGLEHGPERQPALFADPRAGRFDEVADAVRDKLGEDAVRRGRLVRPPGERARDKGEASSLPERAPVRPSRDPRRD